VPGGQGVPQVRDRGGPAVQLRGRPGHLQGRARQHREQRGQAQGDRTGDLPLPLSHLIHPGQISLEFLFFDLRKGRLTYCVLLLLQLLFLPPLRRLRGKPGSNPERLCCCLMSLSGLNQQSHQ
jgi:hypothetical protein